MEFNRANLDIEGSVGILTLNHPEVMNAVSPEMLGGLMQAIDQVEDPKNGLRCVVMTGAGRGFCAGATLRPSSGGPRDSGLLLETLSIPSSDGFENLPSR